MTKIDWILLTIHCLILIAIVFLVSKNGRGN